MFNHNAYFRLVFDIDISRGSLATRLRCTGTFDYHRHLLLQSVRPQACWLILKLHVHTVVANFRSMQCSSNRCLKQFTDAADTTDSGREFQKLTIL